MILALVMLLSLTACGGGKGKSEVTELVIWGHQEEAWNKSYEKIAADFMKDNPDIKIRCEFFPYDEFESKVQTSLMSKTSEADIYEIWGGWAVDYASTGALAPLCPTTWQTASATMPTPAPTALWSMTARCTVCPWSTTSSAAVCW